MGSVKINVTNIMGMSSDVSAAQKYMRSAADMVQTAARSTDANVQARSNIRKRLSDVEQRIKKLEKRFEKIGNTVSSGANSYNETERKLESSAGIVEQNAVHRTGNANASAFRD